MVVSSNVAPIMISRKRNWLYPSCQCIKTLKHCGLKCIPTDFGNVKYTYIYLKHFQDPCITNENIAVLHGVIQEFNHLRSTLTKNKIPAIFPNCPKRFIVKRKENERLTDTGNKQFERKRNRREENVKCYDVYLFGNFLEC